MSEDIPDYGVTPIRLSEIVANDDDNTWFVKFESMASEGAGEAGWWKAFISVCILRIANESIEALRARAEAEMRKVLRGLS